MEEEISWEKIEKAREMLKKVKEEKLLSADQIKELEKNIKDLEVLQKTGDLVADITNYKKKLEIKDSLTEEELYWFSASKGLDFYIKDGFQENGDENSKLFLVKIMQVIHNKIPYNEK